MPVKKKPSLLDMAAAAVPDSAKFDLAKDEVVKQILTVPLVKVLPNAPTVAQLFQSTTVRLLRVEKKSRKRLYPCNVELFKDPDLLPYFFDHMVASGRTADGDHFLAICQMPNPENPNAYHTSGLKAMQIALQEPVARKPFMEGDASYQVMRFGPGAKPPEILEPEYGLGEIFEMAFDGVETLTDQSAVVVELKSLQVQES